MKVVYLTLFVVVLHSTFMMETVGGQGMVAVPSPADENSESSPARRKTKVTHFGGTKEDKEKADVHKKIAATHLRTKGKNLEEESVAGTSEERAGSIVRKDKPVDLQNPQKHASDEWLLHFLLEQYSLTETSDSNVEEQIDILQNLEHFAHKFENGRDLFQSTNALKRILLPALNSTYPEIRKAACGVFAVAAQNNAIVQKTALQNGVVRRLVHLLTFDLASVRSKALFALSSLLRNYAEAQRKFILDGGISALVKAASLSETRKRSLNVVTDLLMERRFCRDDRDESGNQSDSDISSENNSDSESSDEVEDRCDDNRLLEKALESNEWCDILVDSLSNVGGFDTDDQILITEAVEAGLNICMEKVAPFASVLHRLLVKFEQDEDSATSAAHQVQVILAKIDPLALAARDEL